MYGWFEPGGSVNKFFVNTKMNDVLLRTSGTSNNLVFGNTSINSQNHSSCAGIYISQNCVGVQRIPDSNYSLDVGANMRVNGSISCGQGQFSSNGLWLAPDTLFGVQGLLQSPFVLTNDLKTQSTLIQGQRVVSFTANMDNTLNLILESSTDLELVTSDMYFKIQNVIYKIKAVPTVSSFVLQHYFADEPVFPLAFGPGSVIDIQLLDNFSNTKSLSSVVTWFTINSWNVVADTWSGTTLFSHNTEPTNLIQGQYYSFSQTQEVSDASMVIQLVSLSLSKQGDNVIGTMVMKSVDGTAFPLPYNTSVISNMISCLVLLDVVEPPSYHDGNAAIGTYIEQNQQPLTSGGYPVLFKNTSLSSLVNPQNCAFKTISSITINGLVTYYLNTVYNNANGLTVGELSSNNSTYAFSIRGTATYKLIGTPISINAITVISPIRFEYSVSDIKLLTRLSSFVGHYMYFCSINIKCRIISVDLITSTITLDNTVESTCAILYNRIPPILYIIPFKKSVKIDLGESGFLTSSLVVGGKTSKGSETLTVMGDASVVKTLLIRDATTTLTFPITYSSSLFTLGNGLDVSSNTVTIQQDTFINGTITANEYLSFSDRRIKKHITSANYLDDLELCKKIEIKDFCLKENGKRQKGVIAQEIEQLIPEIVHEKISFMPSICKYVKVTSSGSLVLTHYDKDTKASLKPGTKLQIQISGKKRTVNIERIVEKKSTLFIGINEQYPVGTIVYIKGPFGPIKTIDKDYLFMLLFSSVKALIELLPPKETLAANS